MAKALFIGRTDLVKNSILNGNIDTDKFIQFISMAQEIHIQNYLGTKLYDKISTDILASNLTGDYLTLVNDYIQPMLIHYALIKYLPQSAYQISNGGVFKHRSENSEAVSKDEIDFLVQEERETAEHYTRRFVDYMCDNSNLFPEYNDNSGSDVYPEKDTNFTNFVL